MSVIGIDIGVKNLAVCQIDTEGVILNWVLIDCVQESQNTKEIPVSFLVRACALKIDEAAYAWIAESAIVAIESQPFGSRATAANNRMRCIQSCIETWAALRAPEATVMSIGAKSKNVEGNTYAQRKKNAVSMVTTLIEGDVAWSDFFASAGKKRDDLADAFLIARAAVERTKPKKRRSRKRKDPEVPIATNEEGEVVELDGHLICPTFDAGMAETATDGMEVDPELVNWGDASISD